MQLYLAYPLKSLNCIWLHCIRLQKKPSVLQLYPVAMYPVAIVSGCNCIRLYLARLCTCIPVVSLYPVAVVSGQMLRIVSQLYLKKPKFFSLYPVAIVSGCTVSGCSFCLFGVATGSRKILPFAQPRRARAVPRGSGTKATHALCGSSGTYRGSTKMRPRDESRGTPLEQ